MPATNLTNFCYQGMFKNCTSLTIAPELPAEVLTESCYQNMFNGCTSLTTAPELPATTLATECYTNMFKGCTSLNSIKIGYTGYYDSAYFNGWVTGVSASGAFYYNGDQTAQDFKLPNGWTTEQF